MIVINKTLHISIILIYFLNFIIENNSVEFLRDKRQLRGRGRVNATSVILETEQRINNRTNPVNSLNNLTKTTQSVVTCGGIFTQPQFIIETPQYPSNYPSNANCLYIFKGPYCETNYTLQFLDFNLEDSLGCVNDRLEVKFKDALCGTKEGLKVYNTLNGILELSFISNGDTTARGFRILVARSVCLNPSENDRTTTTENPTTTIENGYIPSPPGRGFTPTQFPIYPSSFEPTPYLPPSGNIPPSVLYPNAKEPACCATTYNNKRFFISSPGFPHGQGGASQCSFTIYRANDKVCRLRIQFHYFSVGVQDDTCSRGFLQIDGKLICGCHTGLKLVSPFEAGHLGNTKVFRYINQVPNFGGSAIGGFAIEVNQDECPKRYSPDSSEPQAEVLPRFNFYNDRFNTIRFPNITHEEQVLPPDNTEIFETIDLGFKPRVVKHVYFFGSPDLTYDVSYSYNKPREVEETTYLETIDLNALYPSGRDFSKCSTWGTNEWNSLNKDVAWQRMPKCNDISRSYYPNLEESSCKEYNFYKGYFQSPGYPYYYPKNLNLCYRFYKQAGYCKIRLIMLDFQVEDSFDCRKDYVLLNNNFRYCGQSLANTFTLFDMKGKSYEEIRFVTNDCIGGRGFRGIYEQIPCAGTEIPYTTTTAIPQFPTRPPYTTTTIPPLNMPCLRNIKDDYFTIDIYDYGKDMCNFNVYKTNPKICRLEITFVTFDFPCDLEYLEIDGKTYCGKLSGQMVNKVFDANIIPIIYKRISFKPGAGSGLKLHLVGRQSTDCIEFPPAQRILEQKVKIQQDVESNISYNKENIMNNKTNENSILTMQIVSNQDTVSVILQKKYPEICGIVINSKHGKNDALCESILNMKDNLECILITNTTIYVPFKTDNDKLELKFKDMQKVEHLDFKQITCDNKFIL